MVVLSNNDIPDGEEYNMEGQGELWKGLWRFFNGGMVLEDAAGAIPPVVLPAQDIKTQTSDLAEVERVRQFFPETWLWEEITVGVR